MKLEGRSISKGRAEGVVLKLEEPLSFLGGVDASTGALRVQKEGNVSSSILVFPTGKGSTVGSFVMYDLAVHGVAPAAVVNASAETIVATGAVISSIPMVDSLDVSLIKDGDNVIVDGDLGFIEIKNVKMVESSSSVVCINGKILMLHRHDNCKSFPGKWSLVAGKKETGETSLETAVREIREETGIIVSVPIAEEGPIYVRENDIIWKVHMFAFEADDATPVLNNENKEFRLCSIDDLKSMDLVPFTFESVKRMVG